MAEEAVAEQSPIETLEGQREAAVEKATAEIDAKIDREKRRLRSYHFIERGDDLLLDEKTLTDSEIECIDKALRGNKYKLSEGDNVDSIQVCAEVLKGQGVKKLLDD